MNRLIAISTALMCVGNVLNARIIQGYVFSSADSTAIVGANCRLYSEGKFIVGTSVGETGIFSLATDVKTALNLTVSMTGYSSTDIVIESGVKNLNIGTVYLDEGTELGEVTVTANSVINSKGRTIVYPSGADVSASATSLSLFQKFHSYTLCRFR
ncbi:MAG: carboxypeptidase-like regulatory domain-containing protein [Paramuribaculum sp.]|nr:carboxypeptidase-like regulatory domain-containing protein [Paramuribaculum sp.]